MKPYNAVAVVEELISYHKIPVTKTTIWEEIEKHPNNYSLYAIGDVLSSWKVPNGAFQIQMTQLNDKYLPCIAHLKIKTGEFAVIHKLDDKNVFLSNEHWNMHPMPMEDFKNVFSGNILLAQSDEDAGEVGFKEKRRKELLSKFQYPILLTGAVLAVIMGLIYQGTFIENFSWRSVILAVLKASGLIATVLLLIHSIDANNPLIERLCTGKKNDCNAVLSSKAAKITDFLNWSEVGFFYFSGSLLFLLFNNKPVTSISVLAFVNLLCLPYTFYSIYYQWKVVKQWCVFCTVIQGILWLEFFTFLPILIGKMEFPTVIDLFGLLVAFMLPVIFWMFLRPFLKASKEVKPLELQLRKFKNKRKLFEKALKDQTQLMLLEENETIILGNVEAENILTIVSNPFCQPCAVAHGILHQWLNEKDSFKLQIVFTTGGSNSKEKFEVAGYLHQLNSENKETALDAIHAWYEHKHTTVNALKKAYPNSGEADFSKALETQRNWCRSAEITETPVVLLNGYRIPHPWSYQDIKYFL